MTVGVSERSRERRRMDRRLCDIFRVEKEGKREGHERQGTREEARGRSERQTDTERAEGRET